MKKFILSAIIMALCSQGFASQQHVKQNDNGEIFLSLTKYAEPLKDLTTNLTVVTQEEIEQKKAVNLGEIIEGELGISVKGNGPLGQTPSVFMRGATAGQTLVLIDGRQVNEAALGMPDFTSIPANMIEKVEIIRGSGAAVYGTGAFGGVINVITKKATPFTKNFNSYFSYGTFNTINTGISGGYANDTVSVLIAPALLSSDGYRPNSFYDSKNIFTKFIVKPTDTSEFVLSGQAYNADIGNPGPLSYSSLTDKQFEDNYYFKLDFNKQINDFNIKTFGYNSNLQRQSYSSGSQYNYYTNDRGLKTALSYKDMLFLGIEYNKTTFEQKDFLNKDREKTAGYFQGFLNIENLTFIPAIRYEISTDYNDVCTPALSMVYKSNEGLKLTGNISKVWNAPTFNQLFYKDDIWLMYGDSNLKPEEGISSDMGIEFTNNNFSIALTGFYIKTKNLINWDYDASTYITQAKNIDETRQYGYEVAVKYNMSKLIQHKLNYTYLRAEDWKLKQDLYYRPMHNINYALTLKPAEPVKITADISYVASTRYQTGGNFLKDYCIINVKADYQITKNISLWAKCKNLTNEKYQLSYDFPMAQITGYSGIDIKF